MTGRRNSRTAEGEAGQALYNTTLWRKIRRQHLATEPLCRMCARAGVVTEAKVCDHIERHKGDPAKFYAGPFQSLCTNCHNRHKQSHERGGKGVSVIGLDGWPIGR